MVILIMKHLGKAISESEFRGRHDAEYSGFNSLLLHTKKFGSTENPHCNYSSHLKWVTFLRR